MTKVNQSNENETKTDIFPWDMFKSGLLASSNSIKHLPSKKYK